MAIEIVDFPIQHGDFPLLFVGSPEGTWIYDPERDVISIFPEKSSHSAPLVATTRASPVFLP